jgi:hypothetical protein
MESLVPLPDLLPDFMWPPPEAESALDWVGAAAEPGAIPFWVVFV